MSEYIQLSEEFYKQLLEAAKKNNCTIEEQLDKWARIGLILELDATQIEIEALLSGNGKVRLQAL